VDGLVRNIKYGARLLTRTPGATIAIIVVLALSIGANSAVFAAIDAILLRSLPFPDGDRLMRLTQRQDRAAETFIAPTRLEDWQRLNATFEAITGYYVEDVSELSGDFPEQVRRASVAPRFVDVWQMQPAIGRGFTDAEYRFGGPPAVLVSDRYWRRRLGADPDVLSRQVRLSSTAYPIVGVMPAAFLFPDRQVDLWFPVPVDAPYAQSRQATWYTGIGRLRADVTSDQAVANLQKVQDALGEQYPATDRNISVDIVPLKESAVAGVRASLWVLFGAVSLLLLIACTNVAALLLSRAAHRHKELSICLALGASRAAVAAQLLTETALLAVAGAAGGVVVATAALAAFRRFAADLPRVDEVSLDVSTMFYVLACTVAVALACGVLPAFRATRSGVAVALAESSRTQVSGRQSLQWLLVGMQVTLSVTLLAAAGLLLRSFQELARVDPGFEPSHVLALRISASFSETADYPRLVARIERTLDSLQALPGVDAAATSSTLPGVPTAYGTTFELVGGRAETAPRLIAESRFVSPAYFAVMQIPLVSGTPCRPRIIRTRMDVMVNRSFAEQYFSGSSAIGQQLTGPGFLEPGRIVGIVGDARERGMDQSPAPTVYFCFSAPYPTPAFLVRTRGEPSALAQAVRQRIKEIEPLRSVYELQPLERLIGDAFVQNRLRTVLVVLLALTALSLACVGLYGAISYTASLRRREVGLRLALGAMPGDIVRQFVARSLRVVGIACISGVALALAFSRALSGMLYGVAPTDPLTLSAVLVLVLAVAAVATLIPAMRVAFVRPMQVLRDE
jgi:putative ABC transport system permease protein